MKRLYINTYICLMVFALQATSVASAQNASGSDDKKPSAPPALVGTAAMTDRSGLHYRADGDTTPQDESTAAISNVDPKRLLKYPDLMLTNALQGQAAGLVVSPSSGDLGTNASLNIRGLHTYGDNAPIVIIDGVIRPMRDLIAEDIESMEVLKDASAKVLYGPSAANGVILIKTKRGIPGRHDIRVSAEYGISSTGFTADYLDSYNYASLYNEARANDGMPALYLPYQLEGYKNSAGANDALYPNVDYNDQFLRKTADYLKAAFDVNGGNRGFAYNLTAGYVAGNGLEKRGRTSRIDKLNLRANLDFAITDFLSVSGDVSGRMWLYNTPKRYGANMFDAISTHTPNEYALVIDPAAIGMEPDEDGTPVFGGSLRYPGNLYADTEYGGSALTRYANGQASVGMTLDLNKYVEGLTGGAYVSLDNYNYLLQQHYNTYSTYSVRPYLNDAGEIVKTVDMLRKPSSKNYSVTNAGHTLARMFGWRANVGYARTFDKHSVGAMAAAQYNKEEFAGQVQDRIEAVYSVRLNYNFDKRYLVEFTMAQMGANNFTKGNRYFLSPVGSIGWIMSREEFLRDSDVVNFLKIKASYGVLGYSRNTGHNLDHNAWYNSGTMGFGETNSSTAYIIALSRAGNPNLKWERSAELNIGVEWSLLKDRLHGEANYFNEKRSNIIGIRSWLYSETAGRFAYPENFGRVRNQGVDAMVNWHDKAGKFSYDLGVNFLYNKDKVLEYDESPLLEDERKMTGKSSGTMYGLQALGLYGRDVALAGAPVQAFGPYQQGDIAYRDLTGDGMVDSRDQTALGRNFPTTVWGLHTNFKYDRWGLYMLFTAETGASVWLNSTYFWNYGDGKYSSLAADRYHPDNNPSGRYPRLTTGNGSNNFRNSDFWLEKADFLRLKNFEVSYTLTNSKPNAVVRQIKIFTRGTNVATLKCVKDIDPEMPNAGITAYPLFSTYTLGVSVSF